MQVYCVTHASCIELIHVRLVSQVNALLLVFRVPNLPLCFIFVTVKPNYIEFHYIITKKVSYNNFTSAAMLSAHSLYFVLSFLIFKVGKVNV